MEAYNKGGIYKRVTLIRQASSLETRASDLYHEIKARSLRLLLSTPVDGQCFQRSSDIHAAHLEGAFVDPGMFLNSLYSRLLAYLLL